MKRFLSLMIPSYIGQSMEVILIDGQERYLVHDIYTWFAFSFVGDSTLYQSIHDAHAQMNR